MSDAKYHAFDRGKLYRLTDSHWLPITRGEYPFPFDWAIFGSNACNHSCSWCMYRQNREQFDQPGMLPRALYMRAVEDAARTGAKSIHFSGGGEPLLNPHTPDAIRLAGDRGVYAILSTNGRFLTPEIAGTVDRIRVSLNAGTEAQHFRTNHAAGGKSDWREILDAIGASAPSRKRDIGLAFAVDHHNFHEIYIFCQVAADLGVDFVHIRPAFWYDAADDAATRAIMPDALALSDQARRDFGERLEVRAITDTFANVWEQRSFSRCRAILSHITLTATGQFAVCQDRTDLRFGYGYKTGEAFESIWGGDEHRAMVESIVAPGKLEQCPRCIFGPRNEIIDAIERDDPRIDMV
jgi:MoaA/NifB/PqqE/SkfB family radical SAM enzyme